MTTSTPWPSFPPDEAASRRRIRRYAVPRWMIEQATERRLAGDWRGACAMANVAVRFELSEIAGEYGAAVADALDDDLRHFAPDLLRWHLPRVLGGRTTIATDQVITLAGYGGFGSALGARTAPYLKVSTPMMVDGPQRLTLSFGRIGRGEGLDRGYRSAAHNWMAARHLWDVRHTAELLERCGGGDRAPFFNADGTPRTAAELPTADPGRSDPATHTEWVTLLHQRGRLAEAFAAAGIELDTAPPDLPSWYRVDLLRDLTRLPLALTRLDAETRRLAGEGMAERFRIPIGWPAMLLERTGSQGVLRLSVVERDRAKGIAMLPEVCWRRLPDLDLLRVAGTVPERLHPLVGAALFPDRAVTGDPVGPADPRLPSPVRVRCRGGQWHQVCFGDGELRMPHTAAEQQRERAMRAFGGAVAGCFAVAQSWTSGTGRLPRALRDQRRELFARTQHGDTPGVLRLLDAGVDPRVRNARQRTLLHQLHLLDFEPLLPRLLAAGVDLEARDHHERTPLHVAVGDGGSAALVQALLAAGARIDVVDHLGCSLGDLIRRYKRSELQDLKAKAERDHPNLGGEWWPDEDEYYDDEDDDE